MSYTKQLTGLIENVEKTREARIEQKVEPLNLAAREKLLTDYHPDYIESGKRALRYGPNKGDKIAHEIADVLEAYSFINPDLINLGNADDDVDVLVIGAGGAGMAAAIEASQAGAKVLLITKLRLGDANTVMAQGGIQAADKAVDSPVRHYLDVMGGGHFTNDPELVRTLTENAPETIHWLEELGVIFDKKSSGELKTIHGGGTSRKRMHSSRDYSGLEICRVIRDKFLNSHIPYHNFTSVVEFIKDDSGKIGGVVTYNMDMHKYSVCRAKTIIIATGGIGRLHIQNFPCSNHYGATGDGIVLGYRAGLPLRFMHAIQYHPTGAAYPNQMLGILVTEKVRGLGAQLVNCDGERFIYELQSRDVVASGIIREVQGRGKGVPTAFGVEGVWLDSPLIDSVHGVGTVQKELPAMYKQFEKFGIKIDQQPILVYPTQHYQNGGIKINTYAQTDISNLYAAGEVSGGIHGENRLMGNSLLDILVFGRRAGKHAAESAKQINLGKLSLDFVREHNEEMKKLDVPASRKSPILLPTYDADRAL